MFPMMGKVFPNEDSTPVHRLEYQAEIAAALKRQLGDSHKAIKMVMRWAGVSERTAKNWFAGSHAPAGDHLIALLQHSDEVLSAVLTMSGRTELNLTANLLETRERLASVLQEIDVLLGVDGD